MFNLRSILPWIYAINIKRPFIEELSHRNAGDAHILIRMGTIIVSFTTNSDYEQMVHFFNYLSSIP